MSDALGLVKLSRDEGKFVVILTYQSDAGISIHDTT